MRRYSLFIAVVLMVTGLAWADDSMSVGSGDTSVWGFSTDDSGGSSYLGVDIRDVTSERVATLKLKDERGVEVTMVDQDAPAGKAGLKEHDVILSLNGQAVESEAQLRRMIHETPAGRVVTLGISRDGQPMTIKVQLGERPKDMGKGWPMPPIPPGKMPEIEMPSIVVVQSSSRSGLTLESLTPQLGEFFGVKNGKGALVRAVDKGSRADKAGLKAGDVITKIDDQPIMDASDFTHALRVKSGQSVTIGAVRDKKLQTFTMTLPEKRDSSTLWKNVDDMDLNFDVDMDGDNDVDIDVSGLDELEHLKTLAYVQPAIDGTVQYLNSALEQAGQEIDKVKPEIERAQREGRRAAEEARREVAQQQREMQREMHKMQRELRQQSEEMRRQSLEQKRQIREQQRHMREELRREMRQGAEI
jgi:membrane-associated protease RseP (regulator of RpoE activity)